MTTRQQILAMTATAALLALPLLAMAQNNPAPGGASPTTPPTAQGNPAVATDRAARATTGTMPGASSLNTTVEPRTLREGRRASKVIGAPVYNEAGDTVGQVDDVLIPPESGPPVAIISVGGFLGIGAKLVAVPYEDLRLGESRWTLPGATKESLNALPGFSYDSSHGKG